MNTPTIVKSSAADLEQVKAVLTLGFSSDALLRWVFPAASSYLKCFDVWMEEFSKIAFENNIVYSEENLFGSSLWHPPGVEFDNSVLESTFEYIPEDSGNLVGSFESIGKSNYVSGALLNANVNDVLGPFPTLRGQSFIKVLEVSEINESDFEEKKESLKFSLIIQRQNLIWGNWLQALRDESEIEDYRFDFY